MIGKQFGILHLRRFHKLAIHHNMQISIQLFLNGFNYFGMTMAHIGYTDTADKINIFFAINIIKLAPSAFTISKGKRSRRCLGHMSSKKVPVDS